MEVRWAASNVDRMRTLAKEVVDLQPDVILTDATPVTAAVQRETRTIPMVFVFVSDPIGSGFVASLPRPGGNITGFSPDDPRMGGKWLQLLTEIAWRRVPHSCSTPTRRPMLDHITCPHGGQRERST